MELFMLNTRLSRNLDSRNWCWNWGKAFIKDVN